MRRSAETEPIDSGREQESTSRPLEEMLLAPEPYNEDQTKPSLFAIAVILAITILGFTIQTEATAYYQEVLHWPKPFLSLYLTHSCLIFPWLVYQILFARPRRVSWLQDQIVQIADLAASTDAHSERNHSQATFTSFLRQMSILTAVLTVSSLSWFVALAWTTPSDLTVIYNCSAFFAAIFSVPILGDRLTRDVIVAVAISFIGTVMIAYGSGSSNADTKDSLKTSRDANTNNSLEASRVSGNLVAIVGAGAHGLYCVLFKKWTATSQKADASQSLRMTFAASGLTGLYSLLTFWIGLVVLSLTGVESFELPSAKIAFYVLISVIPGSVSMTSVLVLTYWTNPVFGSVASILCVFFVAMADWMLYGSLPTIATYVGGGLIFSAFGLLAWDESSRN